MRKKIIAIIISVMMCLSLFTGCSLFEYDQNRDYMQVIATVKPITITEGVGEDQVSYTEPTKTIYKYELVSSMNNSASSLVNNGYTLSQAVDYLVDQLITSQIVLAEANAQIKFGNITWGQFEKNEVLRGTYEFIDDYLLTITNEILEERGEPTINKSESAIEENTTTTYPTKVEQESSIYEEYTKDELVEAVLERGINSLSREKAEGFVKYKLIDLLESYDKSQEGVWQPDTIRYPGMFGSDANKSLEREAMRRLLTVLRENVKDNFRLTDTEKSTFIRELNEINTIVNRDGIPYAYPALGTTELMKKFVGEDLENNLKISLLQQHITSSVETSESEVLEYYNTILTAQKDRYKNVNNFYTDIKSGSVDPLIYYPNGDYYYVKHILVPFSDAQTADLSAYKAEHGAVVGESGVAQYKNTLGQAVMGYAHINGENFEDELTIQEIYADIADEMAVVSGDPVAREQKFDELIYKYNTDDGIFGNELGYAVKAKLGENEEYDATYMEEFARAADALYKAGKEGAISDIVVTDYGVHILYLSKIIPAGGMTLGLNDFVSNLEQTKIYDKIEKGKLTEKQNNEFNKWIAEKIGIHERIDGRIDRNQEAYADLKAQ